MESVEKQQSGRMKTEGKSDLGRRTECLQTKELRWVKRPGNSLVLM